jgi:Tfp pilus assembly pilus retraction ATPase PilT
LVSALQAVICQRMVNTVTEESPQLLEIMISSATVKKLIEENHLDKLPAAIEMERMTECRTSIKRSSIL